MITAVLFTIAKIWKQPKYSLTDKWIKKMWYMYVYIYIYTHIYIYTYNGIVPFSNNPSCGLYLFPFLSYVAPLKSSNSCKLLFFSTNFCKEKYTELIIFVWWILRNRYFYFRECLPMQISYMIFRNADDTGDGQ